MNRTGQTRPSDAGHIPALNVYDFTPLDGRIPSRSRKRLSKWIAYPLIFLAAGAGWIVIGVIAITLWLLSAPPP